MNEQACIFCNLQSDRFIDETELSLVFRDAFPVTNLHTLIIPKRHVSNYFNLTEPERQDIQELLLKHKHLIEQEDRTVSGYNIGINVGQSAGQTVFHVHTHLIPRRNGDVENPRGGIRHVIPSKGYYSKDDENEHSIVIKFGGGLITSKNAKLPTLKPDVLQNLAKSLRQALDISKNITAVYLVHGAGSFGHPRSKHWNLAKGRSPSNTTYVPDKECTTQLEAVHRVRQEMQDLASHVAAALKAEGLTVRTHPPHLWARNVGSNFLGDISKLQPSNRYEISLTWGDPVDVDGPSEFGILSGDDIVVRLATEMPNVKQLIFCVGGGVDGILRRPPDATTTNADLITEWTKETQWESHHDVTVDVTGGIGLKAARGAIVKEIAPQVTVQIINGEIPSRVLDAMVGRQVIGTTIRACL